MINFDELKSKSKKLDKLHHIFDIKLRYDFASNGLSSKIIVFEKNNLLTISIQGDAFKGSYKVLNNESIIINDGELCLYDLIFFDIDILVLRKNDTDLYKLYTNTESTGGKIVNLDLAKDYLNKKYYHLDSSVNTDLLRLINVVPKFIKNGYNFKMGSYRKYSIEYKNKQLYFYQKASNSKFYLFHKDIIIVFDHKNDCISYLIKYSNEI